MCKCRELIPKSDLAMQFFLLKTLKIKNLLINLIFIMVKDKKDKSEDTLLSTATEDYVENKIIKKTLKNVCLTRSKIETVKLTEDMFSLH